VRKLALSLLLMLTLSFLQTNGTLIFEVEAATSSITVNVASPLNQTYTSRILNLNVTAYWNFASIDSMSYSIDGLGSDSLSLKRSETEPFSPMHGAVIGLVALPELAEGPHNITVYIEETFNFPERYITEQVTACFTVDRIPLKISVLSVENGTYNQPSLPLNFTINESTSWIGYSIDNEGNMTLTGNTTLTAEAGLHILVLYANDTSGNMGKSDTILFAVDSPTPFPTLTPNISPYASPTQQPTPTPTDVLPLIESERIREIMLTDAIITVTVIITIISGIIALIYFKKIRK
jgi:hypothetical protein